MNVNGTHLAIFALSTALVGCSSTNEPLVITQQDLVDPTGTPSPDWKLIWQDEFDGDEINKRHWNHEENCWGGGNNEQQCYTDRAVNSFVSDGVLHLVAIKGSFTGANNAEGNNATKTTLPYTSARLNSKHKGDWKYGRFEIRALLPHGQGTWPAIWMLPTDNKYGTWAASGEIDIVEAVNLKAQSDRKGAPQGELEDRVHGTLHYGRQWPNNTNSGTHYQLPDGVNPADGFHTYAIEWEEGEIRWYVDNVHYATQTQEGWYAQYEKDGVLTTASPAAPFNEDFHIVMNLAVGGSWAGNTNEGGIDSSAFPQTMAVDYVRVYRCTVDRWSGKGCATKSTTAEYVKGNSAPAIVVADENYGKGNELVLFDDELHEYLSKGSYDPEDLVDSEFVSEPGRGQVLKIEKSGEAGNIYFISPEVDLRDWKESGEIVFDLKVIDGADKSDLLVKMDSGWPMAGDIEVPYSKNSDWQEVRLNISDIVSNGNRFAPGSTVNLEKVTNILIIEPTGPMTVLLDNIRLERK
ncbi:glycoside hydrolase family 16 protein [Vibrio ulleungensis]|uniref:Family 16 glycosylhydrolase n=1 Tax=Vibrio ulleungensis TaxID=2807619 RepID=A0ABS2HI36_9VIBR|nr:glycoside hydrolase family 16 protein [Vibrio ulleungensis]MBM7035476.1 family 16 glycosylhydrolase [Vibrio ulleungensis]